MTVRDFIQEILLNTPNLDVDIEVANVTIDAFGDQYWKYFKIEEITGNKDCCFIKIKNFKKN